MEIDIPVMGKYLPHLCLIIILVFLSAPLAILSASTEDYFVLGDPGYLPNSVWYALEITKERIIIVFTLSNLAKSDKLLMFSSERISEAAKMAQDKDKNNTQKALERYTNTIEESANRISDCDESNEKTKQQIEKIKKTLELQINELSRIRDESNEDLKGDFDKAINKAEEIKNETCERVP